MAFTGNIVNAFSVDGNTLSVDAANNRIGIGTTSPTNKLEINNGTTAGAVKIVDGTQGANKVLMSDANGVGTWNNLAGSWFGLLSAGTGTLNNRIDFTTGTIVGSGGSSNIGTTGFTDLIFRTNGLNQAILNENGNLAIGTLTPTAKADILGDASTAPIRARNIPNSNDVTLIQATTLMPLLIDANGVMSRQYSPTILSGSYAVNQNFSGTSNVPLTIFNSINPATIVTFKFATNLAFGSADSGMISGHVSYSIINGF